MYLLQYHLYSATFRENKLGEHCATCTSKAAEIAGVLFLKPNESNMADWSDQLM